MLESISEHQRTKACGEHCWQCALRNTQTSSFVRGSETDLTKLWTLPLHTYGFSFEKQQDPLEFLAALAEFDLGVLNVLRVDHVHALTHEQQCKCPIHMPHPHAPPVSHAVALLKLPDFDADVQLPLPDLLQAHHETIEDGGLPCPMCKTETTLQAVSSWRLGAVSLIQLVRETAPGLPLNRIAVFAPATFEHEGAVYSLRCAVLHRGEIFSGGHYLAFVLDGDGTWVQYNDGDTPKRLPREPQHLQTHARYFLYERTAVPNSDMPRASEIATEARASFCCRFHCSTHVSQTLFVASALHFL